MKISIKPILRTDLPTKGNKHRIDFRVYYQGKQYKFSTSKFIQPELWDKCNGKVLGNDTISKTLNTYLLEKLAAVNKRIIQLESFNDLISLDDIRSILTEKSKISSIKTNALPLDELVDLYIKYLHDSKKRINTIRKFESFKNNLKAYEVYRFKKRVITLNHVDFQFIQEFSFYLRNVRKNNLTSSNKGLKNFRTVWYYAIKIDFPVLNPFKHFKLAADARRDTYLNIEEYNALLDLVIEPCASKGMHQSKELFVFACETGLRYSDVVNLKWNEIDLNFLTITKIQIKNSNKVIIPTSNVAKKILNKRRLCSDSEFVFPRLSNQYINRNLKEMMKILNIYKIITFHVARHTFASQLGIKGATPQLIMALLGDKDMKQAYTYINMDANDIMKQARNYINIEKKAVLVEINNAS